MTVADSRTMQQTLFQRSCRNEGAKANNERRSGCRLIYDARLDTSSIRGRQVTLTSEIDSNKIDDELYNLHGREVFLPLKEGSVPGSIH